MRSTTKWACIVLLTMVLLSGCGTKIAAKTGPDVEPIKVPYRPFETLQVCLDTPPYFAEGMFRKAANAVADRLERSVQLNSDGMDIYVSRIASDSWHDD